MAHMTTTKTSHKTSKILAGTCAMTVVALRVMDKVQVMVKVRVMAKVRG